MRVQTIDVRTTTRSEMVDVTTLVRNAVRESGIQEGVACIFCPHTTGAVTLQENSNPAVKRDVLAHMSRLVPREGDFEHSEDNSDAHIKSALAGASITLIVADGRPVLGPWQAIYLCEFDGPRSRNLHVQCISALPTVTPSTAAGPQRSRAKPGR